MSIDFSIIETRPSEFVLNNVFSSNTTHNVSPMWSLAGIYDEIYNSEGKIAGEIITKLKTGLSKMRSNRKDFEKLNPANGWGSYESAISFLEEVIKVCEENPKGIIEISK